MNRRGFLGSILAASVAPAIVRADSLMRIVPTETLISCPRAVEIIAIEPLTLDRITREALLVLERSLSLQKSMQIDLLDARFPISESIVMRRPLRVTC